MEHEPVEVEVVDSVPTRIGDDDRNLVIDHLQAAASTGHIELSDFEDRTRRVYAAQYAADLIPITADLPAPRAPTPVPTGRRRKWLLQLMGGAERRGNWDTGEQTISVTVMGGQVIDLTEVSAAHVKILALTLMGGTEIIVPDGALVELRGFIIFGSTDNAAAARGNSPMRVTVRSLGAMGGCTVRNLTDSEQTSRTR